MFVLRPVTVREHEIVAADRRRLRNRADWTPGHLQDATRCLVLGLSAMITEPKNEDEDEEPAGQLFTLARALGWLDAPGTAVSSRFRLYAFTRASGTIIYAAYR
jgi:hypothetical protein